MVNFFSVFVGAHGVLRRKLGVRSEASRLSVERVTLVWGAAA
jgi:hypothetical protein